MTAHVSQEGEYDTLVVVRAPTSGERAFTFGPHMQFDRIPAAVLFGENLFSDTIVEARTRMEGERLTFPRDRREALEEWFANRTYVEQ